MSIDSPSNIQEEDGEEKEEERKKKAISARPLLFPLGYSRAAAVQMFHEKKRGDQNGKAPLVAFQKLLDDEDEL